MTEHEQHEMDAETLKRAMKAFKKRLKLTVLDDDSRLGPRPVVWRLNTYELNPFVIVIISQIIVM